MEPTGARGLGRRFARHLARSGLLAGRRRLLVALSGGLDSMCLLHLLRFGGHGFELRAAHFDHALRPDSASDADWVRGVCRAWGVPLTEARAAEPPRGEAAARGARYAFLQDALDATGAEVVLTAHHADDQAETLLFRLARGTGIGGLAGIRARRGFVIRPLLPFQRAELLAYAQAAGLRWREDRSNLDLRFARNRIRHVVLPALHAARPDAARHLARLAGRAAEAESAWRHVVREAAAAVLLDRGEADFALARDRLLAYHPHVRTRVVRYLLHELGSRPDRSGTRSAMEFISSGRSGGRIDLAGGVRLQREFDRLLLQKSGAAPTRSDVPLEIRAVGTGNGSFVAGGQEFVARWAPASLPTGGARSATFDPSALRFPLHLRAWRPGDRIRMAYGSKKLKKLLQERRVGRGARAGVPVLVDAAGDVLWVVGIARSERALPTAGVPVFTITVLDGESF